MSTRKIWKFWWNSKNTLQWKVPAQFDPSINLHPEYNYGYGYMSNPILYSFLAQSCIDDSINLILETISNIITLIKDFFWIIIWLKFAGCFLLLLRVINSLLTYSLPSYIIHHSQYQPRTWLSVMIEFEPKHGFMYIRYYGSLRS